MREGGFSIGVAGVNLLAIPGALPKHHKARPTDAQHVLATLHKCFRRFLNRFSFISGFKQPRLAVYGEALQVYAMLCVWSVSGQELAAVPTGDAIEDVIGLKRHLRSQHGFPVCLQQLLQAGRCLRDCDPLVGPVDLQLVLLAAFSPKQTTQAENEFLEYAVGTGHVEVGRALLAAGVHPDSCYKRSGVSGETALIRASRNGRVEIARLLLDAGADANLRDIRRATALMYASSEGKVETVRLLLDVGADKNLRDNDVGTALTRASKWAMSRLHACCWTLVPT